MVRWFYWTAIVLVAGAAGFFVGRNWPAQPSVAPDMPSAGTVLGSGRIVMQDLVITLYADMPPLPAFVLHDARGQRIDAASLHGRFTLLAFGTGHCRKGCRENRAAIGQLLAELPRGRWRGLFVRLDGTTDDDAREIASDGNGLTTASGAPGDIARLTGALRARRGPGDHDHDVWLIDPDGRWVGRLAAPVDTDRALARLQVAEALYVRARDRN